MTPTLSTLFGQEPAVGALRRAFEADCLPGTYLFVGPRGVGKGGVALAVAKAAACLNPTRDPFDACGVCGSCTRIDSGTHPEVVVIQPFGEQTQIWQFWDREGRNTPGVLSRSLIYAPVIGRKRVYIVDRAETLNESAANSLLKVLEEPPPYVLFILLAPHPARVLPTIVSRSQMVRLRALPVQELADYLHQSRGMEPLRADMLAAYCEGHVGQALTLADSGSAVEEIAQVLDYAETIPDAPRVRALRIAEELRKLAAKTKSLVGEASKEEPEGAKEKTQRKQVAAVLDLLIAFFRDLLTISTGGDRLINQDRRETLQRLARFGSPPRWYRCLDAIMTARRHLDTNTNVTLLTEVLAMRLVRTDGAAQRADLI